ncbi:hypothetical protein ABT026_22150 [Streptomyces sp. NPDC002734]|uniref:hypothetical protein n=1 Tax=Streptomyces sp. NPDC002734 TaxID=3154426 RepID=UPI0033265C98
MTQSPEFATTAGRLLEHRGLRPARLAARAGVDEREITALLAGSTPDGEPLRRLAVPLGLPAVDLFVLAGLPVPGDLAPLSSAAGPWAAYLVMHGAHLTAEERRELLDYVRSLPQEDRVHPGFAPRVPAPRADLPGGRVIRMFRYRNLDWSHLAKVLAVITPTYLSASTYGVVGSGRKELTPRLVTDFAALLGVDAVELAGLTDVVLDEAPPPPAPEAVDAAALLWEARRLSAAQARQAAELALSLRGDDTGYFLTNLPARRRG